MSIRYVAVKHWRDSRRYAIRNTGEPLSYILGPNQTFGSYRYKRDAQKRADELNACESRRASTGI